ncbi:MAG: deoxyhypusine synthase family protein, partial [Dehalococcoidia bacterium]
QITMDQPQWGGLSGCTFEEAQSWRKIAPEADFITVNVEVTVALPLIVSALVESHGETIASRRPPSFSFDDLESKAAAPAANGEAPR